MEKLFTREEAESLLETVRPILEQLRELRRQSVRVDEELQRLHWKARGNGHDNLGNPLTEIQRRRESILTAIGERVDRIRGMGIQVKDLDAGLIDFPSRRGQQIVYLCWRLGEPSIAWWHPTDIGFAGRQPLDD